MKKVLKFISLSVMGLLMSATLFAKSTIVVGTNAEFAPFK